MTNRSIPAPTPSRARSRALSCALACALPLGCANQADRAQTTETPTSAPAAAAPSRADASLLSRELLFGNPDKVAPQLSGDGSKILYLAPKDGVMNVWVGDAADGGAAAKPITHDTHRGVRVALWSWGGDRVIYIQDKGGDENWHVYAADPEGGETKDLTPIDGVQAQLASMSRDFPDELLVGLNDRDPAYHDVYRVNVKTGARALVEKNTEKYAGYSFDDAFKTRLAMRSTPDGGMEWLIKRGKRFQPLTTIPKEDMFDTSAYGYDRAGKTLYMSDSRGRETGALVAYDMKTGKQTVIAEDPQVNLAGWLRDAKTGKPLAVTFDRERVRWQVIDEVVRPDLDYLKTVQDDDFAIIDQTLDDQTWLVAYYGDDGPTRYYVYDRAGKRARLLFSSRAALEDKPLTPMHPVVIKARDGLELVSFLSLPLAADPDGDGRPDAPVPMVLLVHGGPWGRVGWGYDSYHQWLASRGYAVLDVNFRGSTGFTKSFANAGDREWAGKMHDDLIDAVRWAVDERVAAPDKVAIMGASYGGYATLVGLTFTPDAFACGVDIVGPSSLVT
ncbi:MAG: S9 family peptidase, partial [Myxococcales bacterium]|nr:S9 family peptidase [Myxococcales bacterium]